MAEKKTPAVSPATESAADPRPANLPQRHLPAAASAAGSGAVCGTERQTVQHYRCHRPCQADYRATHKVGVQSCKVYVKPEEALPTTSSTRSPANWTCNFSAFRVPRTARRSTNKTRKNASAELLRKRFVLCLDACYFFALPQRNFRFCSGSGSGISNT